MDVSRMHQCQTSFRESTKSASEHGHVFRWLLGMLPRTTRYGVDCAWDDAKLPVPRMATGGFLSFLQICKGSSVGSLCGRYRRYEELDEVTIFDNRLQRCRKLVHAIVVVCHTLVRKELPGWRTNRHWI